MKNFIISLALDNKKRRIHIENEFSKKGIEYAFFDAVTPDVNKEIMLKYGLDSKSTDLTDRELSCFLSHFLIWHEILEKNLTVVGIFEDDIYLGADSDKILNDSSWIDLNVDVIKLEMGWQKTIKTSLLNKKVYGRCLYELKSDHYGAAGYIISNKGAKYLIEYYKNINKLIPVDIVLFDELLNRQDYKVQQMLPAICIQDFILHNGLYVNFKSDIEEERSKKYIPKNYSNNKTMVFRIKRELRKFFFDYLGFLYKRLFIKNVFYK